jgi:hypothetical protein
MFLSLALTGCLGPQIAFQQVDPNTAEPDPRGSVRFALNDAALTLPAPIKAGQPDPAVVPVTGAHKPGGTPADGGTAGSAPPSPVAQPVATISPDLCAQVTPSTQYTEPNFNFCFAGVPNVTTAVVPQTSFGGPGQITAGSDITYLVEPHDLSGPLLFQTTIAPTYAQNSVDLLSKIVISGNDNVKTTLANVGTGVTAGLAVAGPAGAAFGGALELAYSGAGLQPLEAALPAPLPPITGVDIIPSICPGAAKTLNYAALNPLTKPSLFLPITVTAFHPLSAVGFALEPYDDFEMEQAQISKHAIMAQDGSHSGCWRPLPNAGLLISPPAPTFADYSSTASTDPALAAANSSRPPVAGDGWFYRIVLANPQTPPAGHDTSAIPPEMPALNAKPQKIGKGDEFPYSTCQRGAVLEITWSEELAAAFVSTTTVIPKPAAFHFHVIRFPIGPIPDPQRVSLIELPAGGGTIAFNPNCQIVASGGALLDYGADIGAAFTTANTAQKAIAAAAAAAAKK